MNAIPLLSAFCMEGMTGWGMVLSFSVPALWQPVGLLAVCR